MRVLSPIGVTRYVETKDELTPCPEQLTGKVVGILDDGAGKEYHVRIEELVRGQFDPVQIIHKVKLLLSSPAPPEMLDEYVRECDVVIVGVGI